MSEQPVIPQISVIVPTHNRVSELPLLIDALRRQTLPEDCFELLIVDDGSSDETWRYLEKAASTGNLRILRQDHGGASRARNLAAQAARGKVLAFTDDDCRPEAEWLAVIDRTMQQEKGRAALLGHTFSEHPSSTFVHAVFKDSEPVVTCNFAVTRDAFLRVGGFDEHFKIYFEDEDLGLRLKKAGTPILYLAEMRVLHAVRYQSFKGFLRLRNGLQYLPAMSRKHPENDHWHRHQGVLRQIRRKFLLFSVPSAGGFFWHPLWWLIPVLLGIHFLIDGRRAWKHRGLLEPLGMRLRWIDFWGFTFLGWAVPFRDAFLIGCGYYRDHAKQARTAK